MKDMYDYILESNDAIKKIVDEQTQLFQDALNLIKCRNICVLYLVGSGTSYNAAVSVRSLLEDILDIHVTCLFAMEFVDNEIHLERDSAVIGISQAGRSESTIEAIDRARDCCIPAIALTSDFNSPLTKHADAVILMDVGEENVGPKTKGYFCTAAELILLAVSMKDESILSFGKDRVIESLLQTANQIPEIAEYTCKWYEKHKTDLLRAHRVIVIGYGSGMGAMLEGTLKLLECLRCSVTGYEMEEFMHGVYHAVDKDTYIFALGTPEKHYQRMVQLLDYLEVHKGTKNYLITASNDCNSTDALIYPFSNALCSLEYLVPLQVIARKLSLDQGVDCCVSASPDFHKYMKSYQY